MIATRAPIILEGQVYYDEKSNTYLVVTRKVGEMVRFTGQPYPGVLSWSGNMEDVDFIERFQPVDPADLQPNEIQELLTYCAAVDSLKIGYIKEN